MINMHVLATSTHFDILGLDDNICCCWLILPTSWTATIWWFLLSIHDKHACAFYEYLFWLLGLDDNICCCWLILPTSWTCTSISVFCICCSCLLQAVSVSSLLYSLLNTLLGLVWIYLCRMHFHVARYACLYRLLLLWWFYSIPDDHACLPF